MGTAHYKPLLNSHNAAFGHCTIEAWRPERLGSPQILLSEWMLILFLNIYSILYLAAAGLSCGMWDLCSSLEHEDLSLGTRDLVP